MPTNGNALKSAGKSPTDRGDKESLRKRRANDAFWNNTSFHKAKKNASKK